MKQAPLHVIWWLVSRASGVVALVLISLSVMMGLAMAAKVLRRPAVKRAVIRLHEHVALIALVAIAIHGASLLGDGWLNPGLRGITVPFAIGYRPTFTGLGIIAGYLALLLGPSFYLRRRVGARRWRKLHRATSVVWVLAVVHTLGAGSDAAAPWLRAVVLAPVIPIVYLLVLRVLGGQRAGARTASGRDQRPATASGVPSQPRRPRHDEQRRGRLQHQPVRDTP